MAGLLRMYNRVLEKHPWKTQMFQTGLLMGLGDFASQTLVEGKKLKDVDRSRVIRFSVIGTIYIAPALRGWYGVLDRWYGAAARKSVAFKKMATDQLLFAPIFLASTLAVIELSRNSRDWTKTKSFLKDTYSDVLVTNYMIWPAVQLVNFYAVPLEYRLLVVQVVALFFNTYLAWRTNLPPEAHTLHQHQIGK